MNIIFEEGSVVGDEMLAKMSEAACLCIDFEEELMVDSESENPLDPERVEISVTFVTEEEIRALNREYRGVDRVTDVLSFPQFDSLWELPAVGEIVLGDVVICKKRAKEQAEEFGHSFEREVIYLFVHSILHLLGYDHMEDEDKALMRRQEERVMTQMGLSRAMEGEI